MNRTMVLNVVGLTPRLLPRMPALARWARSGYLAGIRPPVPAVTCTVQASYLTGEYPDRHGVVANGWYSREDCEVRFWKQSNRLVQGPKLWEAARQLDPTFTCANLFWWFNMYAEVDYSVTPRPMYPADGRKIPDVYTQPADLRRTLQAELGPFPLFKFWGPMTDLSSTRWIAEAAKWIDHRYRPTLQLVYLPHLDYVLQRRGPDHPEADRDLQELDGVVADLIARAEARGTQVVVLSEYGITPVSRPVHLNRVLREEGLVAVREELGREQLDPGASRAFAMADHQVAHVYVKERRDLERVHRLLAETPGVERVLDAREQASWHMDHPRTGDLVAIARPGAWFTYYYWLDDARAPDYARTVDIHRKPGYDPVELFWDPALASPRLKAAWTLVKGRLGMRTLLEVVPLDAMLVKGSHGRPVDDPLDGPVVIAQLPVAGPLTAPGVFELLMRHLDPARARPVGP